jgi:hypothetical protein
MRRFVLVMTLIPALASAEANQKVPARFGYQGRLLDRSGAALHGMHQVTFRLYRQPTGGVPIWSETQRLALTNGFYATFLGAVEPMPVDFDSPTFPLAAVLDGSDLYLGIAVDGTEELAPRQQIGAVVYALRTAWAVRAKDSDHADEAAHAASASNVDGGGVVSASSAAIAGTLTAGTIQNSSGSLRADAQGNLTAASATIGSLPGRVLGGGGGFACSFAGFTWSGWGATCNAECSCGLIACTMRQPSCRCLDPRAHGRWLGSGTFLCVE